MYIYGFCLLCIVENGWKVYCFCFIVCLSENYGLWSNDICFLYNIWCVMSCLWIYNKEKKKFMIEFNRRYKNCYVRKGFVLNF